MFSLLLLCRPDEKDQLIADLWESGTAGIQEEDGSLRAFFEDGADANALTRCFAACSPQFRREESRDWAHAWQDLWEPLLVGSRFFLVPAWRDDPTPPGRLRIEMHPGQACGTGAHPASQLSLVALEEHLTPGATVLDIGTGSGILAEAALLLGAARAIACDIDPLAIAAARERGPLLLFRGSARSVRSESIDLAVANINAVVIADLAPEIRRALKPGGAAILAGFTGRDRDRVEQAAEAAGLRVRKTLAREKWIATICRAAER
jgi:ribosomal protein L11 methyltransferase